MSVTRLLAEFAASDLGSIPDPTRRVARRTILSALSLAIGACRHPAVEIALQTIRAYETPPQATVLGRRERCSAPWAALANGIGAFIEDFDDTHLRTILHAGAAIVPAALATAEFAGSPGEALLEAVVAGVEITFRVGNAMSPEIHQRGWHVSGALGHLGAAAAAARLLGLDAAGINAAIGIASTQAAGLGAAPGSYTRGLHLGKAAADGIEAAVLASEGFTAPPDAIEGRRGLASLFSPRFDPSEIEDGLGVRFELDKNTFKPYACGIVSHPIIDAAIAMRAYVSDVERIARIEAAVNPVVPRVLGTRRPTGALQSKFSAYHNVAVGLIYGAAGPAQFTDETVNDPRTAALREKVELIADATMPTDSARMRLILDDGTAYEHHVLHATGSAASPMTDEQIRAKADLVARPVLGERTDAFIAAASEVDRLSDLAALVAACTPPG